MALTAITLLAMSEAYSDGRGSTTPPSTKSLSWNLTGLKIPGIEMLAKIDFNREPLVMKSREWIAQFPKGDQGYFLIAEVEGKVVGFCYLAVPTFYKPIAYIGVAVEKKYRRKNLGSQMFYNAAQWAASKHLQYIIADIWNWNIKSLKFFENLGFREKTRFLDKFKGEQKEKVRLIKRV